MPPRTGAARRRIQVLLLHHRDHELATFSKPVGIVHDEAAEHVVGDLDLEWGELAPVDVERAYVDPQGFIDMLLLIRETRPIREARPAPARASRPAGEGEADRPITLRTFANTTFIALGAATVAWTMMQQGIFYSVLPVHAQEQVGITPAQLGALVSFAGLLAILVAYPNGLVSDRLGRKFSLVPGLLILAAGMALLSVSPAYIVLVWAMAAYGLGEGMTMGTTQALVMDLAPARARGTFIGVWSLLRSLAGVSIPLLIGGVYEFVGAAAAFGLVAGWMLVAAGLVVAFAKETGSRSRPERGPGS